MTKTKKAAAVRLKGGVVVMIGFINPKSHKEIIKWLIDKGVLSDEADIPELGWYVGGEFQEDRDVNL